MPAAQGYDNKTIGLKLNIPRQVLADGASGSSVCGSSDCRIVPDPDGRPFCAPDIVVKIKALACELPCESVLPLSRYSNSEIAAEAIRRGIVAEIGGATIWRWLDQNAIRPWQFRSWISPRDPRFEEKAGRCLICTEECGAGYHCSPTTWSSVPTRSRVSIQGRQRKHVPRGPRPRQAMRVEHEYERRGALCFATLGRVPCHAARSLRATSGIAPSTSWSVRPWTTTLIDPLLGCSGSSTTAPRIAVAPPSSGCSGSDR